MPVSRLITVEEHVSYSDIAQRSTQIAANPTPTPDPEFVAFMREYGKSMAGGEDLGATRLAHMDAAGVDVQVVSHGHGSPATLDHPDAVGLCREVNDRLAAEIAENPERFAAFATLPLVAPEQAADELSRCVEELGFKGVLIAGTFHGQFLDHRRFRPILRRIVELDVPLYVHPFPVIADVKRSYYSGDWSAAVEQMFSTSGYGWHLEAGVHVLRLILAGVLDELPGLKIISGHWGEMVPGYLERLDDQMGYAYHADRPISQAYREQVYVTPSGIFTPAMLQMCLTQMGPDHILWSEDYPYLKCENTRSFLDEAEISDDVRERLGHGTAEKLLKL